MNFYEEIFQNLREKDLTKQQFNKLKSVLCKKYSLKKIPTNIEIFLESPEDLRNKLVLISKPGRTGSGVAVIALMTKPFKCPHGKCSFCPGGIDSDFGDVPQSYTGREPATMRGQRANFDPYLQVFNRLEQYIVLNQSPEKAEIIIMGGTFPSVDKDYQNNFIKETYQALNDFSRIFFKNNKLDLEKFKEFFELPADIQNNKERTKRIQEKVLKLKTETTLEEEKLKNETSKIRCIGLTIETRPDYGLLSQGNLMLDQGCTRVELGIQSVYNKALKKINRGHSVEDSIKSIRILRDLGFKLNFHYMPGLPGLSEKEDLEGIKSLFTNPDFKPDMLKIYPCMVFPGTEIYKDYKAGKYEPLTTDKAAELISELKRTVPEYCRIMRVQRDIPTKYNVAGVDKTNLRQYVDKKLKEKNIICRCIRCRQPELNYKASSYKIKVQEYEASKGKEFFISAEENDKLLGFVRLRFISQVLREEFTKDSAIIRELHVYGKAIDIGNKGKTQHIGIGKTLMNKAEEISKNNNKDKILVISGVGVREYYRKLGYKNDGPYVSKLF